MEQGPINGRITKTLDIASVASFFTKETCDNKDAHRYPQPKGKNI